MIHVQRAHGVEVSLIEGENGRDVEPLGHGDHACVGDAERKVAVLLDQVGATPSCTV